MANTSLRRQPRNGFRQGGKKAYHGSRPQQRTFAAASGGRAEGTSADEKWERTRLAHSIDEKMGFARFEAGRRREGWLVNVQPTSIEDDRIEGGGGRAALDLYFIDSGTDGSDEDTTFKATLEYEPYFLVAVRKGHETEVEEWCKRVPGGGGLVKRIKRIEKEDLQMPNHLLGFRRSLLELRFDNVQNLLAVRRDILPIADKNKKGMNAMDTYAEMATYALPLLSSFLSVCADSFVGQIMPLTCLTTHATTRRGCRLLLWMQASLSSTSENTMFHTMCG